MFNNLPEQNQVQLEPAERLSILFELDQKQVAPIHVPLIIDGWSLELWQTRTSTESRSTIENVFITKIEPPKSYWEKIGLTIEKPFALVFSASNGEFLRYTPTLHRTFLFSIPLRIVREALPNCELLTQVDNLLKRLKDG